MRAQKLEAAKAKAAQEREAARAKAAPRKSAAPKPKTSVSKAKGKKPAENSALKRTAGGTVSLTRWRCHDRGEIREGQTQALAWRTPPHRQPALTTLPCPCD